MQTSELEGWLARYKSAWERRDADAAAALFTPDALYRETPFDEPKRGHAGIREYWTRVTADQRKIDFQYDVIACAGTTGVAHWSVRFELASQGVQVELDGAFVLVFDDAGLCVSLREWWHVRQP